jgi:hypothetical protein
MECVKQHQLDRLTKLISDKEYHGWIVSDSWIKNEVLYNYITGESHEISYLTKDFVNPLPFHQTIEYVGVVHLEGAASQGKVV